MKKPNNLKLKFIKTLMIAAMLFLAAPAALKAQAPDGSESNPFPIKTVHQLTSLAERINAGGTFYFNPDDSTYTTTVTAYSIPNMGQGKFFKLVDDITMNSGDVASCDGVLATGWTAWPTLGTLAHPFNGTFDGDGHLLSGLYVSVDNGYAGFFGCTGNLANIKNLGLVNSYVASTGNAPEGNNCGGLIGMATQGTIEKCFYSGTVQNNANYTGGLIGQIQSGSQISNCYTSGFVTGNNQVAGLVGFINTPAGTNSVTESYSAMLVRAAGYSGGAIGEDRGNGTVMTNVYYDRQLLAMASPNTLGIGLETSAMTSGTWYPAGFAASGSGLYPRINLAGFDPSTHPNVYLSVVPLMLPAGTTMANLNSVNTITLGGGASVSWALAESVGAVSLAGTTITIDGQCYVVPKVTLEVSGTTYTRSFPMQLDKTPYIGTAENPFQIDNLNDLTNFRDGINSGVAFLYKHFLVPAYGENIYFVQTNDITMPSTDWASVGISSDIPFKGFYDGGNHAIIDWKYTTTVESGFFGYTDRATIKNLTIRGVKSTNRASLIYSMTGGWVDNCHAEGSTTVTGGLIYQTAIVNDTVYIKNSTNRNDISKSLNATNYVGGILSRAGNKLTIIDSCHNYGNINNSGSTGYAHHVGGIIGRRTPNTVGNFRVTNSSNHGTIKNNNNRDSYVGGIVGSGENGTITYCWNTGNVQGGRPAGISPDGGTVSYCYNLGDVVMPRYNEDYIVNGISRATPSYCFNAGKVINQGGGSAYGISENGATHCFNAGDVSALSGTAFAVVNNTSSRRYSLGRLSGRGATVGGCYIDSTRVPFYRELGNGAKSGTANMMGEGMKTYLGETNWVYADSVYPRIKGLDTLTISKALSLPIFFKNANDNVDNVTNDFVVRKDWGITWKIEGTSGATITDSTLHLQKVTLPSNRTQGNIILAACKDDSVYYRITLVMGVAAPGTLTVDNLAELKDLRTGINSGSAFNYKGSDVPAGGRGTTFVLTNDITLDETNWVSLGNSSAVPFRGTFNGKNHTISGLTQNRNSAGFFGYVEGGTVDSLVLSGVNLTCYEGGSICCLLSEGTISHCSASGNIKGVSNGTSGSRYVGGLVSATSGTNRITSCTSKVNIAAAIHSYLGGIVGQANSTNTVIDSCLNGGLLSGARYIGGISCFQGTVKYCVNYGDITTVSEATNIAGITANTCNIDGCVNSGNITIPTLTGNCNVAGIGIGNSVTNSYNVGSISGNNATNVAGIYYGTGTCENNYNAGQLTGTGTVEAIKVGNNDCTNCYYDTVMCGAGDSHAGALAKNTVAMCGSSLSLGPAFAYQTNMYPRIKGLDYTPASWATAAPIFLTNNEKVTFVDHDFTMGGCSDDVAWSLKEGNALTITDCSAHINAPGVATICAFKGDTIYKKIALRLKLDAFVIKNATELANFRDCINTGEIFYYNASDSTYHTTTTDPLLVNVPALGMGETFRVCANIDLGGQAWTSIGSNTIPFSGVFDGGDFNISNFTLSDRSNYIGLFGYVQDATLKNIVVKDVTANSLTGRYAGILSGYIYRSVVENVEIANCSLKSTNSRIGAVSGHYEMSMLGNIYVHHSTIQGKSHVGGVTGSSNSKTLTDVVVSHCEIKATEEYTGGVIGYCAHNTNNGGEERIRVDTTNVSGTAYVGGIIGAHAYNYSGFLRYGSVYGGSVTGSTRVGGIAGGTNGLSVDYCYNSADVKGTTYVGGIVGNKDYHSFTRNTNIGNVEGTNYVGGLMGVMGSHCTSSATTNCYASVNAGKVVGDSTVGGLVGYAYYTSSNAVINQCINLGDVTGNVYVGGVIGRSTAETTNNANFGRITGARYVGGVVGHQSQQTGYSRKARRSYSAGQVYGEDFVGNVAGYSEASTLANCYYDKQMSSRFKGLGSLSDDAAGVAEGKLTREMLGEGIKAGLTNDPYTYTVGLYPRPKALNDSTGAKVAAAPIVLADTVTAYNIPGINNYPVSPSTANSVSWSQTGNTFAVDGTGFKARQSGMAVLTASLNGFAKNVDFIVNISSDMPCIIKNYAQLTNFTNFINSGNAFYYNTADSCFYATAPDEAGINAIPVAAGGEGFFFKLGYAPSFQLDTWPGRIGTPDSPFKGEFNGDGHTVSYLPNATTDTCGFFGYNAGHVYNLNFDHTNIANTKDYVGVVAGYNTGKIDSCHVVNGTVSGTNYVGAIAGKNEGYVLMCYSSATVNGSNYVGGLCGMSTNSVTNSFNMGDVNGTTFLGGVVGSNSGALANAYNTGNITATGFPNNVGGVVGNTGNDFSNCYSAGQVTAVGENVGGIAGYCAATNISTVAYDNQMCSVLTTFQDNSNQAVSASTLEMTGNALQSVLGTDNWIYADSTYPRLKGMELLDASILSTTPVFLSTGEKVLDVEHDFRVYTNNGGVNWTCDDDAINMDNVPDISFNHCGHPVLVATRGVEEKHINLLINYTGSVTVKDTTCGEPYTWETSNHGNGFTYETSQTVLFPTVENGCPFTYTLELVIPEPLQVTVSSEPEQCYGANDGTATATVTGGLGSSYTYEWTDLDSNRVDPLPTSATITGLAPEHVYRVIVTDALNTKQCTARDSVEVAPAVELVATVDSVDAGCYGVVDGFFLVSFSGGKAPYTLTWSGAAGSGSRNIENPTDFYRVDGLADGAITITVKDANNCEKSFDKTFNQDATAYTVTAYSETKVYDGNAVEANQYTLQIGSEAPVTITSGESHTLANGDVLTAEVSLGSVTNAGVYSNTVTSYTVMRGTVDVTCYYNITPVNSNVVITKRPVTLTSADTVVFYPDEASNPRVTVTSGSFADGETVTYNVTGLQQGSGVSDNTFTINWGSVNGNNYDTTKVYGTLTVVKNGVLIVRGASLNRMYDGTTDTYNSVEGHDYTVAAYFVRGENDTVYGLGPEYRVEVVMNNGNPISMKDADTVENRVTSFHAYYHNPETDLDVDVTMEFERRDTIHGTLAISRRPVELISQGNTWEYDAEEHSLPTVTVVGSFVEGETDDTPEATATITNVGKVTNVIDYHPTTLFNMDNYALTLTQDTLKVTKRPLTIAGVNKYVEVTGVLQEDNDFTYSGLVNGHTASGITFHAEGTEIGEYLGDFSGTLAVEDASHNDVTANYDPDYQRATLYITSADKDLNVVSATSHRMYNGEAYTYQTYTVNFGYAPMTAVTPFRYKLTTGDTVLITPTDDAVMGIVNAGSYRNNFRITILPEAHAANYRPERLHLDTGIVTVDPRPVTLRSMSKTKVYDGEEVKWDSIQGVGNGFVSGEGVTGRDFRGGNLYTNVGTYSNTFEYDWNAGTLAANYVVTIENGTLEVTPATLTVKANDLTRSYGEPNEFTYTISGFASGEDETVVSGLDDSHPSYNDGGGDQYANIGTYTITPVLDGLSAGNYTLESAMGTLTVQKRTMVINAPSVTATYDGTAHTQDTDPIVGTITYTNLADGDVATATMQYSRTTGGESQMTYSSCTIMHGSVDVTENYNITVSDTSLIKVTPAPLTVKVVDTTKVYDGEALVASRYQITSGTLGDGDAVEESTVVYSGSQTNVGTSTSSISQFIILRNENNVAESSYDITFENGTLEVTPKAVTVTADSKEKVYGATDPELTATVTGLLGSDEVAYTLSRETGEEVGKYAITPTGEATQGNYSVTYVEDSLTITKAVLTVTADDKTKMYGEVDPELTTTISGLVNGDDESTIRTALGITTSRVAGDNVGSYTITADGAAEIDNYTVTYVSGTLTITPRTPVAVTIQAHGAEYEYDGTLKTVTGYSVSVSDPLYLESYITFTGTAIASGTGSETALTTYPMTLQATDFANNNDNFTGVTFTVLDSALYIYPKLKAEVTDLVSGLCLGGDNGAATIVVTGGKTINGKYNFSLNGGANAAFTAPHVYDHLTVDDYTVVVTDSLNTSVTVTFSIEGSTDVLSATIVTPTDLCPNQGNYPVSVTVNGGTAPYTYTWTGAQDVDAPATEVVQTEVNDAGTAYTVSVSILDANSCPVEANTTFTVKPSVTKSTSLSDIVCPADMDVTMRYGVYDTLLTLTEPTWTSNIPEMPLTLVNDAPASGRFGVRDNREDSTYTIHWHLVDTCGGDSLICTQTIIVRFPECSSVTAEGHTYQAVRLGANCWTRSNLQTPVPPTRSSANGEYKYNNDDALAARFGLLYSWYAACHLPEGSSADPVMVDGHVQGLCPDGWALPTADDYIIMVESIGGVPHMKTTESDFWVSGLEGTAPSSGFDALGAGFYNSATDSFEGLLTVARFWTATPTGSSNTGTAIQCAICEGEDVLIEPKSDGYSIRCVRVQ